MDDKLLGRHRCAILNLEPRRLRVMKCDLAVQLCACCICGRFFSRQPKPALTLRKNHQWSGHEECREFQVLVLQWVWSHFDDDDEAVCRFLRDPLHNLQPFFWVNCVVVYFVALKLLSFSLTYLLTARNVSVILLGSCRVLVVQSFAISFRLNKVGSLIE